jgi:hypothetical protein
VVGSLAAALLLAVAATPGCGDAPGAAPAPPSTADASVAPPPVEDAGLPVDAGAWRRDVFVRSPFGARNDNLFMDGDFEMSAQSNPGAQFGWRTFDSTGATELVTPIETGGLCKSGLRCAVMSTATLALIRGASAPDFQPMKITIAARPPKGGACSLLVGLAITCDDAYVLPGSLTADADSPGNDGWCTYSQHIVGQQPAVCLYLENTLAATDTMLVDDAVLVVDTDPPATDRATTVPEAVRKRAARVAGFVRATTPLGRPPAALRGKNAW